MGNKIVYLPRTTVSRKRLDKRCGRIRCEVSNRWLQMPEYGNESSDGTFLSINVMTTNVDGEPRKICELILLQEDLLTAIKMLPVKRQ